MAKKEEEVIYGHFLFSVYLLALPHVEPRCSPMFGSLARHIAEERWGCWHDLTVEWVDSVSVFQHTERVEIERWGLSE